MLFLQAPQEHVVAVVLDGVEYVVLKISRDKGWEQRHGIGIFANLQLQCLTLNGAQFSLVLHVARKNMFMLHVDDLLFTGRRQYWSQVFLPLLKQKFNVSFSENW